MINSIVHHLGIASFLLLLRLRQRTVAIFTFETAITAALRLSRPNLLPQRILLTQPLRTTVPLHVDRLADVDLLKHSHSHVTRHLQASVTRTAFNTFRRVFVSVTLLYLDLFNGRVVL